MKILTRIDFAGKGDPVQSMSYIISRIEQRVSEALKSSVNEVKRHLVAMAQTRLTKRSGALQRDVSASQVMVTRGQGDIIEGTLTVSGGSKNKRGYSVREYLGTHFGKGVTIISAKGGGMLAIPIKGGPAWKASAPTAAPKDMKGIMVRIGQVLYAGSSFKSRSLDPGFVLKPSVTISKRVNPQDAVDEAQPAILSKFIGLIQEVSK